jgi:hypothetical protein
LSTGYTVVPLVNITPNRIVTYTSIEGLQHKKKRVKLFGNGALPPTAELSAENSLDDLFLLSGLLTGKRQLSEKELNNLQENKYKGQLSVASKKRLTTAINWLYVLSKDKVVKSDGLQKKIKFRIQ